MQLLRGLRLNCFLAALLPCLLACMGLAYQQHHHQQKLLTAYAQAASHELSFYATLFADEQQRQEHLNYFNKEDNYWQYIGMVSMAKNDSELELRVNTLFGKHHSLEIDNPHPSLIKSQIEAQQWRISTLQMALACPLQHGEKDLGVLYAEISLPSADNHIALLIIISACLFLGIIIAWYLSKRIYQPIEYLCEESDMLIHGSTKTPAIRSSVETAHVASSINDLLALYQNKNTGTSPLDSDSALDPESKTSADNE